MKALINLMKDCPAKGKVPKRVGYISQGVIAC